MMLSGSELALFLVIVFVTLFFHKWPQLSDFITRLRLRFDKGIAEEYIEAVVEEGDTTGDDES